MIKNIIVIVLMAAYAFGCAAIVISGSDPIVEQIYVPDNLNREFRDVNKRWDRDDNMCWLATFSNMISFAYDLDVEEVYDELRWHAPNEGGTITQAVELLCDIIEPPVEDGDIFACRPMYEMRVLVPMFGSDFLEKIKKYLRNNHVMTFAFTYTKEDGTQGAHIVTVYGWYRRASGKQGLLYVDSDDGQHTIKHVFIRETPRGIDVLNQQNGWNSVQLMHALPTHSAAQ